MQKKCILLAISILSTTMAQNRPSFAGTRVIGVPELASRFANGTSDGTSSATGGQFPSRFGANDNSTTIPADTREEADVTKTVASWPRENQPFWFINAQHIDNHIGKGSSSPSSIEKQRPSQPPLSNRNAENEGSTSGQGQASQKDLDESQGKTGPCHKPEDPSNECFTIFKNSELKTYVYDPVKDAWSPRKISP
ncbi:uncharacterized protein isoform X1 [Leptinotarsa decemlineata]|uniref:uncharacterized protein isoform X1 n=2 Tax=Leptinotarsa decemlineata TaxID=7539 RepID=UPI003D306E41